MFIIACLYLLVLLGESSIFAGVAKQKGKGFLDGPSKVAQFNEPQGLAVDQHDGSVYVSDYCNHRIRKVTNGM
jgi:hypothetical protein